MKKILLVLLVFTAAMSACKKDVATGPGADNQAVNNGPPLKAASYIEQNYPDAVIVYYTTVTGSLAGYLVTLDTREELAFSKDGEFVGNGERFHGGHHGDTTNCNPGHRGIPIDSLPAAIPVYVNVNYPGYAIRHAAYDSLCLEGSVIRVMLFKPGSEPVKLCFDPSGNFLLRAERLPYSTIPQAVKDYITANYTGFTPTHRAEKLTLADASVHYSVFVFSSASRKVVRVDAAGTFICEQEGFHHGGGNGGPGGGGNHGWGIPVDSLSAAVTGYISTNYPGYVIRHAHYDSLCPEGRAIVTDLFRPGSKPVSLFFSLQDLFLMQSEGIPYHDLPREVKDYVSGSYPGYHADRMPHKLTLSDNSIQYLVGIRKVHSTFRLRIDSSGMLVCVQ